MNNLCRWLQSSALLIVLGLVAACAPMRPRADLVAPGSGELIIHTLPVGAGNCQFLQCPHQNRIVMFDCGSVAKGKSGWSKQHVKEYIDSVITGGTEVVVALSHSDSDHGNYLPKVFPDRPITAILLGGDRDDYSQAVQTWINQRQSAGTPVTTWPGPYVSIAPEDPLSCWKKAEHGGVEVDVGGYILAVNAGADGDPNSKSMVVASVYGKYQAVFTGDMTATTEAAINSHQPVELSKTITITAAHHGSNTNGSNAQTWVDKNKAKAVMFSTGERFNHPVCAVVNRYKPYLEGEALNHYYECHNGGGYETHETELLLMSTLNNGWITVTGKPDGSSDYNWEHGDVPGAIKARSKRHEKDAIHAEENASR